jgi:hypothetical protein
VLATLQRARYPPAQVNRQKAPTRVTLIRNPELNDPRSARKTLPSENGLCRLTVIEGHRLRRLDELVGAD